MIKRLLIIIILNGAGQLFVIFVLKYLSQTHSPEQLSGIARIDSLMLFMVNLIALGLQPAAMRDLALSENWKEKFKAAQSARWCLGLFLMLFSLLFLLDKYYLAFLLAPLLALSGDYALYGRGFPVRGSVIAFFRVVIPFISVLVLSYYMPETLAWVYYAGLAAAFVLTNLFISGFLQVPFFPKTTFKNLKLYLETLPLGIVSLGLYMIGMGVILVAQYFYTDLVLATVFVGLKFYVIFKGLLRIVHQAFLKEMIRNEILLRVDQLGMLTGVSYLFFILFFPDTFIVFFFGSNNQSEFTYFILLASAAFIYSLFSSLTTRAMLEKKDKRYAIITVSVAAITLLLTVLLSYLYPGAVSVAISILTGEIIFSVSMIRLIKIPLFLKERMLFLVKTLVPGIIPLAGILIGGDNQITFFISIFIFSFSLYFIFHKLFRIPLQDSADPAG